MDSGKRSRWRAPLALVRDALRSQLWPLPVVAVAAALAAGLVFPRLDASIDGSLPGWVTEVAFAGDAGAARTVLDAVSSSMITVTSLTFSLTVVTLQLASSQFSPRLLRTFTSDTFVQTTLGIFLATFVYSLTVLRSVRGSNAIVAEFVPRLSVTLSFVLAVGSVVMLVVFLAHLAQQIRIETMLRDVHVDATATVKSTLTRVADADGPRPTIPKPPPDAVRMVAPSSGFLVRVDEHGLLDDCVDMDLVLVLFCAVGSSIVKGTPIGWAWATSGSTTSTVAADLQERLTESIHTGFERTSVQDVGYGLRQLTDVANKALSPGINDPTTAVHTLGHISTLLCELTAYELGPVVLCDDDKRVRVVLDRPGLADLLEVAITQPRRYGAADPQVMQRLFQLLSELAWHCRPHQRDAVRGQLTRLVATVEAQDFDAHESADLERAARGVREALDQARTTEGAPG